VVLMETDEDLAVGEFGIATRMVQPRGRAAAAHEPAEQVAPGATMIYKPEQPQTQAASPEELGMERETAVLQWDGERRILDKRQIVLGRSRDCDIQLADPNVSRRHAELRQEGSTYWIVDLDSTNGLEVNGRRVKRAQLSDGDTFTLGSTDVRFSREPVA
jgi:pSer/pThr/pTyr-binding forkhead associated (FHA) protein